MGTMHAGCISRTNRLGRVLLLLKTNGSVTGLQLERIASVRAGGTCVSELRKHGHVIDCEYTRTTEAEGKVYTYYYRGFKKPPVRRVRR